MLYRRRRTRAPLNGLPAGTASLTWPKENASFLAPARITQATWIRRTEATFWAQLVISVPCDSHSPQIMNLFAARRLVSALLPPDRAPTSFQATSAICSPKTRPAGQLKPPRDVRVWFPVCSSPLWAKVTTWKACLLLKQTERLTSQQLWDPALAVGSTNSTTQLSSTIQTTRTTSNRIA